MLKTLSTILKKSTNYINFISILILIYLAFIPLKPHNVRYNSILNNGFSMQASADHIEFISKSPHYLGSNALKRVKNYLIRNLQKLNLEVLTKAKYTSRNVRNNLSLAYTDNIFAKLKGSDKNAKTLLLMAHYDSASFASLGTGDDATGVAVILEGMRVFLDKNKQPKNNIMILFTDAEEVGLMGAKAFVESYYDIKNIEMVLNFEARGTAGSSYMLMETQGGNHQMLEAFKQANIMYPNSNSLAYSIYKSLPNDTDLTIFRKNANINGMNFAFIDNHFDYHTERDNPHNISFDSIAHQALYLMPLLELFSNADLTSLHSKQDDVYFQIPFYKTVNYPYSWTVIISIVNLLIFLIVVFVGIKNKTLNSKNIFKATMPLFKSLTIVLMACFGLLKFIYWMHPHYSEILQGFTYNGYSYIVLFILLTFMLVYYFYRQGIDKYNASEYMVFPILVWIIISFVFSSLLTGAHFFVLVSLAGTLSLAINVISKKNNPSLTLILFAPVILLFTPFFQQLPVALGIKIIPFSSLLLVLFIAPFITSLQIPKNYLVSQKFLFICLALIFTLSELTASIDEKRPNPDSLYYFVDTDNKQAYWLSYDNRLDDWNKDFFKENQLNSEELSKFNQTYKRSIKIAAQTEYKDFRPPKVELIKQRAYVDRTIYQFKISLLYEVMVFDLISNNKLTLLNLNVNKHRFQLEKLKIIDKNRRFLRVFTRNQNEFIFNLEVKPGEILDFDLYTIKPRLLDNDAFDIPPRPKEYIAKPFIYSDSIISKMNIKF